MTLDKSKKEIVRSALLDKFVTDFEVKRRSKNTITTVTQALDKAQAAIKKPLEKASIDDLRKYFAALELSQNSISLVQSKFIQFYDFCFEETDDEKYTILARKIRRLRVDRTKKEINPQDILLPDEIKRLINVATLERDRCIIATLYESGMRLGELLALTNSMVLMDEPKQEVVFNIPKIAGCKTGARSIVCLEIYGYVQDWMKCNPSNMFMPMKKNGLRHVIERLFARAGLEKPCNVHFFRHSAITHAAGLGLSETQLSYRFWGIPHSNMINIYIHLNEMLQATGYRDAKGMGNGNGSTVINPLASRCVDCGRLIQSGNLCKQCAEIKELKERNATMMKDMEKIQEFIKLGGLELLKDKK